MSYSKTTWANGDTITAEKLNNIENGIVANETAAVDAMPYDVEFAVTESEGTYSATTEAVLATVVADAVANKPVRAKLVMDGVAQYLALTTVVPASGEEILVFSGGTAIDDSPVLLLLVWTGSGPTILVTPLGG